MIPRELRQRIDELLVETCAVVLDRFDAAPNYPFIDTKFNAATGEEFTEPPKNRDFVYSWIQGRGLEAMAKMLTYFGERHPHAPRIKNLLRQLSEAMETARKKNAGRLWFMMRPNGAPLVMQDGAAAVMTAPIPNGANYSELFYYKGVFAAACALEDKALAEVGAHGFAQVLEDIRHERFRTDQQPFDPKNPVTYVPGRRLQGPRMIALGGIALMLESGNRTADWAKYAAEFIELVLNKHVNHRPEYPEYSFIEALNADFTPVEFSGAILADPGHAAEFAGLAARCLRRTEFTERFPESAERMKRELPLILTANFALGFNRRAGGICKSVDLVTQSAFNRDMPWWNLPETMRAAALLHPHIEAKTAEDILSLCAAAYFDHYANPHCRLMPVQTRDEEGRISAAIPATPDADPGYHTNLSFIDILEAANEL